MGAVRDDFTSRTIDLLAKRAGFVCSNPECQCPTVGAAQAHGGFINVGVASHITAASPGGPRYDPSLTSEERRDQSNGVWLCQTHAKLIDSDAEHFTAERIRQWKRDAEQSSFRNLVAAEHQTAGAATLSATIPADEPEGLIRSLIEAGHRDLAAFKRTTLW